MRKIIVLASVAILCAFSSLSANAQSYSLFRVGGVLPMNDFSDAAGIGGSAGFKYVHPFTDFGLGAFGGLDFMFNGTNDDNKAAAVNGVDVQYPIFINIPISAGLDLTYDLNKSIGVFAEAGLAYNFLKLTKSSISGSVAGISLDAETKYDLASNLGFKIEAGINVNDLTVGIAYYGLGNHTVKGTASGNAGSYEATFGSGEQERNCDILSITVGFRMD